MRVIVCTWDCPDGVAGPGAWERRIAQFSISKGDQVHVLSFSPVHDATAGSNYKFFRGTSIGVKSLSLCSMRAQVKWTLEQVAEYRPDVVIASNVIAAHYAARWISRAGIPVVSVIHSDESFYSKIIRNFFAGAAEHKVQGAIVVSKLLEDRVRGLSCEGLRIARIPCGAPVSALVAREARESFRLIYVGRINQRQKRVLDVARAMAKACDQCAGVEAIMVGDGLQERELHHLLSTVPGGSKVNYKGRIPLEEVQELMSSCHAYVLLSEYEGAPIALMEAMAVGLVPLVSDIQSGVPELVIDSVTGFYTPERDEDFVRAVNLLRSNPDVWNRMSAAARQQIHDNFESQKCLSKVRQFLAKLVYENGRSDAPRRVAFQVPSVIEFRGVKLTESWVDPSMVSFPASLVPAVTTYLWKVWDRLPWSLRRTVKSIAKKGW